MHRRILIVDGVLAFAGGVGIADVWTGNAQDPEYWRETDLHIEGPAVPDLFGAFLGDWTEATAGILAGSHLSEIKPFDDGVALQVTRSTLTGGATAATELFYTAIAGAQRRLWLTTAYFAPDRTFEDGLREASRRGVDLRILVNGREVDKEVARQAGRRSYTKLLEAGVRFFKYDKTMLHATVLIVDNAGPTWAWGTSTAARSTSTSRSMWPCSTPNWFRSCPATSSKTLRVSRMIDRQTWRQRLLRKRAGELATEPVRQSL